MKEQRYQYKAKANEKMVGKYGVVIPIMLIFWVIQGAISSITVSFQAKYEFNWETMTRTLVQEGNPALNSIFSIISFIVGAIVLYATTRMFIQVSDDEKPVIEEIIIVGVKENPFRSIALQFLVSLFTFLWALLFIIPGIVKSYAYSMSFYLIQRKPELNASEAIEMSKTITNGHKGSLFGLDLSYLGWYFLGLFTFGILWLWIVPKHTTARTLYFNEIYEDNYPTPKLETEDFSE